jgi:hypothetical protein
MNAIDFLNPGQRGHAWATRIGRVLLAMLTVAAMAIILLAAAPGHALDLVTFSGISGPLTGALTTIATLTPGVKAIVGVIGFIVAFIALAALRNFGPALFFVGLAIFGAVGLVVAGAIMGAVI